MAHPVLIESKYSGYALLWAGTSGALAGIVIVLLLAYMCYSSKLYKMLPGWGPISRFDADATDELRYRQEVFKHSQEQAGFQRPGEGVWRKQKGELIQHPVYGTVRLHTNYNLLKEERRKDLYAPKDEQHTGRQASVECHASLLEHRLVSD